MKPFTVPEMTLIKVIGDGSRPQLSLYSWSVYSNHASLSGITSEIFNIPSSELGIIQGHLKWHNSIENLRLPMSLPLKYCDILHHFIFEL